MEELTLGVGQLTVGQKELGEQVDKNTAVIGGLKATQKDIKKDLLAIKKECQTVHEELTKRLDEVVGTAETKEREIRTHMETTKVVLEGEIEGAHREIKEVKQKLEEVEEGVSEIKKRRKETNKELREEVMEYVQGLCSQRDDVLSDRIKSLQVAGEERKRGGAEVSGDIFGNVHGVRGGSMSLGVGLDPGVRERPVVRWVAGPECMERGGVQGCPTVGNARDTGEQGYVSMEWVAGCGSATQASTQTGVEFSVTGSRREPSVICVLQGPKGIRAASVP